VDTGTFVFKESTMAKTRPPYTPEFRRQMVELVHAGRSPEELAQEFEPTAQSIRNWVGQANCDAGRRTSACPPGGLCCPLPSNGSPTATFHHDAGSEGRRPRIDAIAISVTGHPMAPAGFA
jgi:transposase-like protein